MNRGWLFFLFFSLVLCACNKDKVKVYPKSLVGVYQTNTPDGEFLLVVPTKGDAYCILCRNNKTDSVRVTYNKGIVKNTSGRILAEINDENGKAVAKITSYDKNTVYKRELKRHPYNPSMNTAPAQHPLRYLEPITTDSAFVEYDIWYSSSDGFYASNSMGDIPVSNYASYVKAALEKYDYKTSPLDLHLDVYYVKNDKVDKRPLIVLLHGGAFLFGDKGGSLMRHLGQYYATRGYVVASVNYRMGCSFIGLSTINRSIYRAVQDSNEAMHFMIEHASDYGIDPNAIFLIGHSAGAITALTSALMTNEEIYADASETTFRKELGTLRDRVPLLGTVSLWGAITDLDLIDEKDNPDFMLLHGTSDEIVPFTSGVPFGNKWGILNLAQVKICLHGSGEIKQKMDQMGLPCQLFVFPGKNHDPHLDDNGQFNANMNVVDSVTSNYLFKQLGRLCPPIEVLDQSKYTKRYRVERDSTVMQVSWNVRGGLLFKQISENEIECYRFSNAAISEIQATVTQTNGKITTQVVN